tara:strand:- start:359 stop:1564 length:1206 start_codon:yes stop_codon:yes gene_type:complete
MRHINKMNKINIYIIMMLLYSVSFSFLKAECDICEFSIEEIFFNESIVGYYMAGFDLSTGDSNVLLFEYLIDGPSSCYYSSSGSEKLNLDFSIDIFSPELGFDTPEPFVSGSLTLSNFTGPVRLKNTDINFSTTTVDGADMEVSDISASISDNQLDAMAGYITSTGKIPNGTYVFSFTLESGTDVSCGGAISSFTRDVEIYEPTFLDLQSPGYKNYSEATESPELSTYPNFIWSTDLCSACNYGIRVCEYNPSIHDSPSSALNDISNLPADQSLDFFPIPTGQTVFSYPPVGAIDLEQEKYYVWQIKRDYTTTVGTKEDYSDIYIFKVSSNQNMSSMELDFLKELIGEEVYNQYFGPGGSLEGYSISQILLNGDQSSQEELQGIINQVEQGNLDVEDVVVE